MQSAFEKEVFQLAHRFRSWLTSHDRVVLIGLVLSIPPIPPIPFVGFLLALFNYRLWKQHKLERHEICLIRCSLAISTISSIAAVGLVWLVIHLITSSSAEGSQIVYRIWDAVLHYLNTIAGLSPFRKHSEVSI